MPRNTTPVLQILTPTTATKVVRQFAPVTKELFASTGFFEAMPEKDQNQLLNLTNDINKAAMIHVTSGLMIGEHLFHVRNLLKSRHGAFYEYLELLPWTKRTLHRFIKAYETVGQHFSQDVILAASSKRINLAAEKYQKAMEKLPPPTNHQGEDAVKYLDDLTAKVKLIQKDLTPEEIRAQNKEVDVNPYGLSEEEVGARREEKTAMETCFRQARNAMADMKPKQRQRFFEELAGYIALQAGLQSAIAVQPSAAPEEWLRGAGRPYKVIEGPSLVKTA